MEFKHISVLLKPTIDGLKPIEDGVYVDATLGAGGHSMELMKQINAGKLIVFDVNSEACKHFAQKLVTEFGYKKFESKNPAVNVLKKNAITINIVNANFNMLDTYVQGKVNGIIADLGFATDELESIEGLSFLKDESLDMRLDGNLTVRAADLINGLYANELEALFIKYGDVAFAKRLAKEVVLSRKEEPINRTLQLNRLIQKIVPFGLRKGSNKHPEAKVYQALRIAVNDELNSLIKFLEKGFEILGSGGKFALISFHSGEDRIVKSFFRSQVEAGRAEHIIKLRKTNEEEVKSNNNSRSAKLRILAKL